MGVQLDMTWKDKSCLPFVCLRPPFFVEARSLHWYLEVSDPTEWKTQNE